MVSFGVVGVVGVVVIVVGVCVGDVVVGVAAIVAVE